MTPAAGGPGEERSDEPWRDVAAWAAAVGELVVASTVAIADALVATVDPPGAERRSDYALAAG